MTAKMAGLRPPKNAPALLFGNYKRVERIDVSPCDYLTDSRFTVQPIDLNDRMGDCASVGWANLRGLLTALLDDAEFSATIDQILALYVTQNPGFVLDDPAHGPGSADDQGMDLQTLCEYLVHVGGPDGVKALAFAKVDHTNVDELHEAISLGAGLLLGVIVTDTQQQEFPGAFTYDPNGANPGGHCTVAGGWSDDGRINEATWGALNDLAPDFVSHALQEAWLVIFPEHMTKALIDGMDLHTFAADLEAITEGKITLTIPTDPTPNPSPDPAPSPDPSPSPSPDPSPTPTPTPDPSPAPAPDPGSPTPTCEIGEPATGAVLTSGTAVKVDGTSADADQVALYDGNGPVLATATPDAENNWEATVELGEGDHELWAAASKDSGAPGPSSAIVDVTVSGQPDPVPAPPGEQIPAPPVITTPKDGDTVQGGDLAITGDGENTDMVSIYLAGEGADDSTLLNVNPVSVNDGSFSTRLHLETGTHRLYAVQRNTAGNLSDPSAEVSVTIEDVPEPPPADQPDERLAHFLRHRLLPQRRLDWELIAELVVYSEEWLETKGL